MPDQWDDWMPSQCNNCGGTWDLNSMYPDPRYPRRGSIPVVCPPCHDELSEDRDA